MLLNIFNQTKYQLPSKKVLQTLLKKTYKIVNQWLPSQGEIDLIFVGPKRAKEIHEQFASSKRAANVLTFDYRPQSSSKKNCPIDAIAEIVICPSVAQNEARQLKRSLNKRLELLFVHGLLHILGYNHKNKKDKEEMESVEDKVLSFKI